MKLARLLPTSLVALAALAAGCAPPLQTARSQSPETSADLPTSSLDGEDTAYMCPMHPDYTSDKAGSCPRCGMKLVLGTPFDMRDYQVELKTDPPVVNAGEPATLTFGIFHPGTGQMIRDFELVHDKPYHLFVISQDMEFFEHIHPQQNADGAWTIQVTVPKPGHYKVLSDFVPTGGSSQFVARPLVTAGYTGNIVADSAHLVPDTVRTKTVDDLTATVTYDPSPLVAGLHGHMTFHLTKTGSDEPVTTLQTYLGAFGHMLMMSEDMIEYVHSHPMEMLPAEADLEQLRGGPDVMFEGFMPKPGRYRAWTQFRYNDTVHTFAFTFEVADLGSSTR